MFRFRPINLGVTLAITGTVVSLTAPLHSAQAQTTAPAQQLNRVEVTGSAIKRTQVEGPAPVEILRRDAIEKTGATSLNELVRNIASMDIFDQGELTSNSPAGSGAASFRMRGLDDTNLLVLINGRRLPVNALYDSSGAGASVDINMIPIALVERVEILKDGGSAIYGADAIAGVVNIITRSDYQGAEVYANYGISSRQDGQEQRYGLVTGKGSVAEDGYNITASIDYFKRDPIYRKDRELSKSVDFRRYGGRDARSGFSPYGNYVDPETGAFTGGSVLPCPAANLSGGICRYDFNSSLLTAYNGADRLNTMLLGALKAGEVNLTGEFIYSQSINHFESHPVPDYFTVPSGTGLIAGRFMQGGPRITDRKSILTSTAVGANGMLGEYEWKVDVGRAASRVTNNDSNYYDATLWTAATESGALDPTVTTNDQAFVDSLKVRPRRDGISIATYVNTLLRGDLFQLPAGALGFAVGAQFRRETLSDKPDPLSQAGNVVGSIQQSAVSADQTVKSVFGELSVPILAKLEGQIAVRYDKYSEYSAASPKLALKYDVLPELAFRASVAKSFKAPALKQLFGASEQGALTISDQHQCDLLGIPAGTTCLISAYQVNGSNPSLKPEKGKTYNVGAIFEPTPMFSGSLDFWWVYKTNEINTPTITQAIESGLVGRDERTNQFLIFTNLQNYQQRAVNGVDLDLQGRFPVNGLGRFTLRESITYTKSNRIKTAEGTDEYADTYIYPKYRNVVTAGFDRNEYSTQFVVRTTGGFWDTDEPKPIAEGVNRVAPYTEVDWTGRFGGIKNVFIDVGVKNVFDRQPPLSLTNALNNTYSQMGFAELYSIRGRFFYGKVSYRFM
ncbi:TonB-dependent receptor [Derxia lacustris]|uniref:TonB-dependent receptor n=1 Tax=Derxia lacustris TaxID=764842 RepID=UPI001594BDE2|nr:TonB-dependent receptor [Derxia lacustris]